VRALPDPEAAKLEGANRSTEITQYNVVFSMQVFPSVDALLWMEKGVDGAHDGLHREYWRQSIANLHHTKISSMTVSLPSTDPAPHEVTNTLHEQPLPLY
jgi:hypothetical protein